METKSGVSFRAKVRAFWGDGKKGSGRLLLEGEKLKLTINDPVPLISPPGAESRENSPMMRRPNQALAPTAVVVAHL